MYLFHDFRETPNNILLEPRLGKPG